MFHHFHDDKRHLKGQGSISKDGLLNLIKFIGRKNILNADDFLKRYKEKKLKKNHVCFTFDDCLKCQFDIAFPVMEELNIKGFFFVYSSALKNISSLFEVYSHRILFITLRANRLALSNSSLWFSAGMTIFFVLANFRHQ